jgi:tRNA pseudouridine38-40 synthase
MQKRKQSNQARQQMTVHRNIRLNLAFEGTAYHGWQIQESLPTVQGVVSEAIHKITQNPVNLTGSGRTDAGTHARMLVANFLTQSRIPAPKLVRALNSILPPDIRILSALQVGLDFHARRNARSKIYRYQIYLGPILAPHLMREYFHYPYPIDIHKMEQAAPLFVGEHDFAGFAKTKPYSSTIRRIFRCELKKSGRRLLMTVEGNGFLHHMVRNMAGTLIEIGKGAISLDEFKDLFIKRDRTLAGFTAPAKGLILLKVKY